jgi:hypothetical protein
MAASRRRVDPDAADYFARIVTAGSTISEPNKAAVNAFVAGCKADGIWAAIKASCLLAGPDDLTGALVPLVGAAPTNVGGNFVSGDYNRTTGLVGDGSTKYLDTNRNNNADPQNNQHLSVFINSNATVSNARYISGRAAATNLGASLLGKIGSNSEFYSRFDGSGFVTFSLFENGSFSGISRSSSSNFKYRLNGATSDITDGSVTPANINICIFANPAPNTYSNARISFYSIGESLDLALLDARLATYMSSLT